MNYSFEINDKLLEALDEYHEKSMLMQFHKIENKYFDGDLGNHINDDLIYNVPIYDMGNRKYASFCSLTEALWKKEKDIKKNGILFKNHLITRDIDWFTIFYLFRLCGSGINYKPKSNDNIDSCLGTHGFGNFWIVNSILRNKYTRSEWYKDLSVLTKSFTDNKGYLLPQFSFPGLKDGHLKYFILNYSREIIDNIYEFIMIEKREIYQVVDYGNSLLKKKGLKNQYFVLTAFACDIAEYFPSLIKQDGFMYAGTNAKKCINNIFPKVNKKKSEFEYINEVLQFQSKRYNLLPMDCEDSRNCDPVRYFKEYQSKHHIEKNNGITMQNNSILKKTYGIDKYYEFSKNL